MTPNKNKVAVGLSGGVDSAATAYLLKAQGYDVISITLYLFDYKDENGNPIKPDFLADAQMVADTLGIPHYIEDLRDLFDDKVRTYFEEEYLAGRTPNPCVVCNTFIKYGELIGRAHLYGAYYLATGHYANIVFDETLRCYRLYKGSTDRKDQAYLLNGLGQEQLKHILLPLGAYEDKQKIRQIALNVLTEIAEKKDSVGICFIQGNYKTYMAEKYPELIQKGDFLDIQGNALGKHEGIINYTIGQKRNLGVAFDPPKYVVSIDADNNTVVLGDDADTYAIGFKGSHLNLTRTINLSEPIQTTVKVCQWGWLLEGTLYPADQTGTFTFLFKKPERAIAPGQTAVFYEENEILGGLRIAQIVK